VRERRRTRNGGGVVEEWWLMVVVYLVDVNVCRSTLEEEVTDVFRVAMNNKELEGIV
jgi:hypothetical protein